MTKHDYVRTDQITEAMVPVSWLPRLFRVSRQTIARWMKADNVETHPHPWEKGRDGAPIKFIRWGDIPFMSNGTTRWHRK